MSSVNALKRDSNAIRMIGLFFCACDPHLTSAFPGANYHLIAEDDLVFLDAQLVYPLRTEVETLILLPYIQLRLITRWISAVTSSMEGGVDY